MVALLFFLPPPILSAPDRIRQIHIVTQVWEDFTNRDGTGVYFDLLRAVYEPLGIKVKYRFFPWKRARAKIESNEADAMLAAFYNADYEDTTLYPFYPMDSEEIAVIFKQGAVRKWQGQKSLENRMVAWPRGYNYHKYLKVKLHYDEMDKSHQGWLMLKHGRVEFYMASKEEIQELIAKENIPMDQFEVREVFKRPLYMWFGKSARTLKLAAIYDRRISALLQSNAIAPIFRRYQVAMPSFHPRQAELVLHVPDKSDPLRFPHYRKSSKEAP